MGAQRADRQLALERSQRLGHMTGASWFYIALARHGREHGGGELRQWDSERETAEYLYNGLRVDSSPHPDRMGVWAEDGRDIAFLLEYDTGSEHLPQLAAKLPGYADLARYPANLAFRLAPRLTCPACGTAWMPLHGGHGPMRLIDLDDILPDPWRTARAQDERERRELSPQGVPPGTWQPPGDAQIGPDDPHGQ